MSILFQPLKYFILSGQSNLWYLFIYAAIYHLIVLYAIFEKAFEPGWGALVPFYRSYLYCKITTGHGWLFLLLLIPYVNIVFGIYLLVPLSKAFGKSGWYALGILFLGIIYLSILAFGEPRYIGVPERDKDEFTL